MHEMSLAMEVCRIAEVQVGLEELPRVREIGVVVGDDSGVEPDALEFCLEALLTQPPFSDARPVLEHCSGDELRVSYLEIEDDDSPD
jgi:Zn finger protein HypA/HybF involved in hydrogenase expression